MARADRRGEGSSAAKISKAVASATAATTLAELRRLTNLKGFALPELQELFLSDTEEDGTITRDAFHDCFVALSGEHDLPLSPEETDTLRVALSGLYALFDIDGNGMVDFTELTSGLWVLLRRPRREGGGGLRP